MIAELIDILSENHSLSVEQYEMLLANRNEESAEMLRAKAVAARQAIYDKDVYLRGLIEFTNYCRNDCRYCGLRRSNRNAHRYRLSPEQIMECADEGYNLGFRTFVLQGGEDMYYTDEILCGLVSAIKSRYPDCAVTLSVGERSRESYQALFDAGADRYLLRHETATEEHYRMLHPQEMSYAHRMECLHNLRDIGYAVGVGFMVGSPYQTLHNIANDLKFIETFQPDMCGIGPFIPHTDTEYAGHPSGSAELTCYLLSIIRLIKPNILLPSTTALGTILPDGRERGILSGANVIMPNLSPVSVRKDYSIYDNKICTGEESAQCKVCIDRRIESIGYQTVVSRGDVKL